MKEQSYCYSIWTKKLINSISEIQQYWISNSFSFVQFWIRRFLLILYMHLFNVFLSNQCHFFDRMLCFKKAGRGGTAGKKKNGAEILCILHCPFHFHPNSIGCYKRSWNLSRKFYGACNRDRIVIYENNALIIVLTLLTSIINVTMHIKLMRSKSMSVFLE